MDGKQIALTSAKGVALVAVMSALLTGGKFALSAIPNVEVVTLLCALYGYVFGPLGLCAVAVFVSCETLIYGFGTWVISYAIHWPLVCIAFWLLGRLKVKNRFVLAAVAVLFCVGFAVLSSLVDVGLFSGNLDDFSSRFAIYFMRGIWFYVAQIVCNALTFTLLFPLLEKTLFKLKLRFFEQNTVG